MKFIFTKRSGAHRVTTPGTLLDETLREQDYGMAEIPTKMLKIGKGTNTVKFLTSHV